MLARRGSVLSDLCVDAKEFLARSPHATRISEKTKPPCVPLEVKATTASRGNTMQIFNFQDHLSRFKGKAEYESFVADFRRSLQQEDALVAADGSEVLGSILSPEAAKEVLYLRLRRTIAKNPEVLAELKESFGDDELVDVPKPAKRETKAKRARKP
jgi:hypothetical protein